MSHVAVRAMVAALAAAVATVAAGCIVRLEGGA